MTSTKKAGYTPGSWKVKPVFIRQTMTEALHFGEYTLDLWGIAGRTTPPNTSPTLSREEAEANAKLIAQCPLMVEALQHCLAFVRQYMPKPEGDLSVFSDYATAETIVYNVLRDAGVIE